MTSFYSWRLWFLTFWGPTRADKDTYDHAHESPLVMMIPLFVLGGCAILAGLPLKGAFIGDGHDAFWKGALFYAEKNHVMHDFHKVPGWVVAAPLVMMLSGFVLAWYMYVRSPRRRSASPPSSPASTGSCSTKWYFDELYDLIFVRPAKWLGRVLWKQGDGRSSTASDLTACQAVIETTGKVVKLQTGYIYNYAFAMLIGVAALVSFYLFGGFPLMLGFGILTGLLVLPLVGALFIAFALRDDEAGVRNTRWVALWTTAAVFVLSLVAWSQFDIAKGGFQLVERKEWNRADRLAARRGRRVDAVRAAHGVPHALLHPRLVGIDHEAACAST